MKIGIITHPLGRNYGGILQNYALQVVLRQFGHEVVTCDYDGMILYMRLKNGIKSILTRTNSDRKYVLMRKYVEDNIACSKRYHTIPRNFPRTYNLDAIIVGSDQVWRPRYVYSIRHMFLSQFININIRRIVYAASFGTSDWEFTKSQSKECCSLVKKIPYVSVREDSGVALCNQYFHIKAQQVLDPTLLIEKEEYLKTCETVNEEEWHGELFCYILDECKLSKDITDRVCDKLKYQSYIISPQKSLKCESVTRWLQAFNNAKFVICDSFHGIVFSIIFHKPFIAIANKSRGLSRFTSLLKLFELNDRMVSTVNEVDAVINKTINWEYVDNIKRKQIINSLSFLSKALG